MHEPVNIPAVKSREEHVEFTLDMTRLALNFVWQCKLSNPDEALEHIMWKRSCLLWLYGYKDGDESHVPELRGLLRETETVGDVDAETFEERLFAAIAPFAERKAKENYLTDIVPPENYTVGSLRYDPPLPELPRNHCNFHITNAVTPKSIFSDPGYLPECFIELMDASEKEHVYDTLRTYTWLNENPKWLLLFPEEWHDNLSEPDNRVWGNLGYWGQFLTARKTFNFKAGGFFRSHGRLQYRPRSSFCSFTAMRRHLEKLTTKVQVC